jgi:hypothetical protein
MSFQLCLRCGRHEVAGSFCTYCRTAEYDLVDHGHAHDAGAACPLGPYLDPLDTSKTHIRDYIAKPMAAWPEGLHIRAHQRTPGYAVETDPPVPSWVRRRLAVSLPEHGGKHKPSNLPAPARGGQLTQVFAASWTGVRP